MINLAAALVALLTALCLTRWLCAASPTLGLVDLPNERSLHHTPTPRGGGLGLLGGVAVGGLMTGALGLGSGPWVSLALGTALLAGVGLWDDRFGMHPLWRLLVHGIAAAGLVAAGLALQELSLPGLGWQPVAPVTVVLSILFVVWMINLYNFMDGMDGFAGGMAVFGFITLGLLGLRAGHPGIGGGGLLVAAAALGFLRYNFPPARIFLGDAGSASLGFLAAGFGLWAERDGVCPLWVTVLAFSPFVVDATVTLGRRLWRGEAIWRAHRSHYYQRLVLCGWGHRRTVLAEYALMLACGISAWQAVTLSPVGQWGLIGAWVAAYGVLMSWVDRHCGPP